MITHRSPENYDPITWVGRVTVYATTIIVALYVLSMVGVAIALASGADAGLVSLLSTPSQSSAANFGAA